MNRQTIATLILSPLLVIGCGSDRSRWEVLLENKSDQPCDATVSYAGSGGKGGASVDGVPKGKTVSLISGAGSTVVESIKLKVGATEKTLTPNATLPAGKKYKITISEDGSVATNLVGG
jgi:hypothetical protein